MLILSKLIRYVSRRDKRDILTTTLNTSIVGIHKFYNIINVIDFIYIADIQYYSGCMILNPYYKNKSRCDYDYTPHNFIDITYKITHPTYDYCKLTIQKINNKWQVVGRTVQYYQKNK
jgi:hypothetical protein